MGVVEETVMSKPSICIWKSLQVSHTLVAWFIFVPAVGKAYAATTSNKISNWQSSSMWLLLLLKETVALLSVSSQEKPPGGKNNSEQGCNLQNSKHSQETGVGAHTFSKHHLLTPLRRLQDEVMKWKEKKAHPGFGSLTVAGLASGASWRHPERAGSRSGRGRWSPAERGPKLASAPTPELAPSGGRAGAPARRGAPRQFLQPRAPPTSRPAPAVAAQPRAGPESRVPPPPPPPRAGGWGKGRRRLTRRAARTKQRPRRR